MIDRFAKENQLPGLKDHLGCPTAIPLEPLSNSQPQASKTVNIQFQIFCAIVYFKTISNWKFNFTTTLAEFIFQFRKLHFFLHLTQLFLLLSLMLLNLYCDSFRLQLELQLLLCQRIAWWLLFSLTSIGTVWCKWQSKNWTIHFWTFEIQLNANLTSLHIHNSQILLLQNSLAKYREIRHHELTQTTRLTLSPPLKYSLSASNVLFWWKCHCNLHCPQFH